MLEFFLCQLCFVQIEKTLMGKTRKTYFFSLSLLGLTYYTMEGVRASICCERSHICSEQEQTPSGIIAINRLTVVRFPSPLPCVHVRLCADIQRLQLWRARTVHVVAHAGPVVCVCVASVLTLRADAWCSSGCTHDGCFEPRGERGLDQGNSSHA